MQDLSPKDGPLLEGSTYRVVLDLEEMPAEWKITGQNPHSALNQLEERR